MSRNILKVVLLGIFAAGGWVGLYLYERSSRNPVLEEEHQKRVAAEANVERLRKVVANLSAERRVGELIVIGQSMVNGSLRTRLVFYEHDRNDGLMPPKSFEIDGSEAHVDAMVIKFQGKYVEGKDPLRGQSVALFTKLFDNKQAPEKGHAIDEPGHIPLIYKHADPAVSEFEQQLWRDFWRLAEDKAYREQMGVDVVQGQSVWWRFEPGYTYTLTLQSNGGLLLRPEPMPPIYRELLKQHQAVTQSATGS